MHSCAVELADVQFWYRRSQHQSIRVDVCCGFMPTQDLEEILPHLVDEGKCVKMRTVVVGFLAVVFQLKTNR